jgi:thiamine biosynthesis lipoprotein
VEVTLFVPSKADGERILEEVKREAGRIDTCFSPFAANSEIRKINDRKNRRYAVTTPEVASLIKTASEYGNETRGAFDITIGPVKWLWGFVLDKTPRRPDGAAIAALLKHVGYGNLTFHGDTIFFSDPETRLDMGGIAKGYSLRRMAAIVKARGIRSFCINAGGDIILGDPKPRLGLWRIGIQHPRRPGDAVRTLELSNTCLATSGDYERFFFDGPVRYHHIFDPRTGYSALGLSSATVICDDPVRGVVYSKYLIVKRAANGLGDLPGVRAYTVIDTALNVREFRSKP